MNDPMFSPLGNPSNYFRMGQQPLTEKDIVATQTATLQLRVEQLERRVEELENLEIAREANRATNWKLVARAVVFAVACMMPFAAFGWLCWIALR